MIRLFRAGFISIPAFIRLGRPHFLMGGFLLHGLGAAMAHYSGALFRGRIYLWGQVAVTAIQLMTHYANDYFDLEADRANLTPTNWSGGSRVLPEGRLSPRVALTAAMALGGVALGATLALVWDAQTGPLMLPMVAAALVLAWSYSAPPLRLHASGWGELTVALLVPGLTPLVGFYGQTGALAALPFLAAFPLGCLQFAMLLSIEFPDAAGDGAAGKRTLVVRLGGLRAAQLHNLALLAAYASLPLLIWAGLPPVVAVAVVASAPVGIWQTWRMARGVWARPSQWNSLAFWSIGLLVLATSAELMAFAGLALTRP